MSKPEKAVLWKNGMLMVFNAAGEQVPEFQGPADEYLPRLKRAYPDVPVLGPLEWDELAKVKP